MIFIQSRHDGFRRCGVAHTVKGREFPDDYFTGAQLKQLNEDPEITMVAGVDDGATMEDKHQIRVPGFGDAAWEKALSLAVCVAVDEGSTTSSGAPTVDAMEEILGENITSAQRDQAWRNWQKENK